MSQGSPDGQPFVWLLRYINQMCPSIDAKCINTLTVYSIVVCIIMCYLSYDYA